MFIIWAHYKSLNQIFSFSIFVFLFLWGVSQKSGCYTNGICTFVFGKQSGEIYYNYLQYLSAMCESTLFSHLLNSKRCIPLCSFIQLMDIKVILLLHLLKLHFIPSHLLVTQIYCFLYLLIHFLFPFFLRFLSLSIYKIYV